MKIMRVDARAGRVETESTEVLVLTHCEGGVFSKQATIIDKSMNGALQELLQSKEFEGKANELVLVHTQAGACQRFCWWD
jgi:leucyl aminopeptidase